MDPVSESVAQLVAHYRMVHAERMAGLPLCNPHLEVEAVGFRNFQDHELGVLITPWFMNLVLLSPGDAWQDWQQGSSSEWELPAGSYEFHSCRDDALPTHLSAILFRTVQDFPDQDMARAVAEEILEELFKEPEPGQPPATNANPISRRSLLAGLGTD